MKIEIGQKIKILFVNGSQAKGIVESFNDQELIIKSFDDKSFVIIPHADRDIMAYEVVHIQETISQKDIIEEKTELDKQFQETYDSPSEDELRIKKLAELRKLMQEQESQIIKNKLSNHTIGEVKQVQYGYPGFFKKQGSQ